MTIESVLIIGAGGREHALAFRLQAHSPDRKIWVCPGNAGIARSFECIALEQGDVEDYVAVAKRLSPTLVVVGPEEPLAQGVVDALEEAGFHAFGPSKACAQLEASKRFMKEICTEAKISTARAQVFERVQDVESFLQGRPGRWVVKADGLCAGKGVTVCDDASQALDVAKRYLGESLDPLFGDSSKQIIVEEFLSGREVSVIGLCDGDDAHLFAPVRDHKRLLDGDQGPNTGGMGVVGPLQMGNSNDAFLDRVRTEVFLPTLRAMRKRGTPYRGFLYAGLMVEGDDIHVLEFNVRLGDPEAQALLFGTSTDLYPLCLTIARGEKLNSKNVEALTMAPTAVVVLASAGYPQSPRVMDPIGGLELLPKFAQVFFAGVKAGADGELKTGGGRVLTCVASGETLALALKNCYQAVQQISFDGAQFRTDIGRFAP